MTAYQHRYAEPDGLRLLRALAEEGRLIFELSDAAPIAARLGISEGYLNSLLSRTARGGWLTRLRRGLYAWSGTFARSIALHPFVIATHLVTPSAISHWSALNHHGLTEQLPWAVTALTTKKVVTPSMRSSGRSGDGRQAWEVCGVRYEYVTVRPARFFGIEEVWVDGNFSVSITDRERTVLELFISPRTFGGIGEALGVVEEHVHELELGKLVTYAVQYGKASVAKRVGWALEHAGVVEDTLTPLLSVPVSGYRTLDPARPSRGHCNKRWMIQENLVRRKSQ